ncbi:MAG: SPOR domain-containing protein, partial [Bacteroidota bacterium]
TIEKQPSGATFDQSVDDDYILQTELNAGYTYQVFRTTEKSVAVQKIEQLRKIGLKTFMSIDYSNPEIKHYRVCLNLFKSRPEAEKAIASIKRA